ncbi:hypothetical protein SERLADRAFT_434416 [Serpula lacrymans var. lacrymans S7.9]|uniref:Uncharacterized protein n=1 Tax=Serpula lacrymans var. lacrymans (strain S7.9) TaxID=578457 RepID=F8NKZ4_SERL9|nr:uncharacterized protein SERLADRAFT_434416 [Serpula lacrymans var. lacrymans S7.9]EGO28502.1 hypothetical protein SERLADRAFT_434416 [Serpula lacrymans var. lacrymans S7.9]
MTSFTAPPPGNNNNVAPTLPSGSNLPNSSITNPSNTGTTNSPVNTNITTNPNANNTPSTNTSPPFPNSCLHHRSKLAKFLLILYPTLPHLPTQLQEFFFPDRLPAPKTSDTTYSIHPFIPQLARADIYIPLTLFTAASTTKLYRESAFLKQITVYNKNNTKNHALDLTQFPNEHNMDPIDWHEAWGRYSDFLDLYSDPPIAQRWKDHYVFLSRQEYFRSNFPAILEFDIEQSTNYANEHRELNHEGPFSSHHLKTRSLSVDRGFPAPRASIMTTSSSQKKAASSALLKLSHAQRRKAASLASATAAAAVSLASVSSLIKSPQHN